MLEITALLKPFCLGKFCAFLGEFNVSEVLVSDVKSKEPVKVLCKEESLPDFLKSTRIAVDFKLGMENSGRVLKKIISHTVKGDFGGSKVFIRSLPDENLLL